MALRDTTQTPADTPRPGDDGRMIAKRRVRSKPSISTSPDQSRPSRETATTGGRSVSARLSPVELEALEALKARHGLGSNSDALRALVRAASGMLEADPATGERLEAIRAELHGISVAVNAIALAANRGRIDLDREHWVALSALRQSLPEMRSYLRAVVDEQRRRGIRLFAEFREAEGGEPRG